MSSTRSAPRCGQVIASPSRPREELSDGRASSTTGAGHRLGARVVALSKGDRGPNDGTHSSPARTSRMGALAGLASEPHTSDTGQPSPPRRRQVAAPRRSAAGYNKAHAGARCGLRTAGPAVTTSAHPAALREWLTVRSGAARPGRRRHGSCVRSGTILAASRATSDGAEIFSISKPQDGRKLYPARCRGTFAHRLADWQNRIPDGWSRRGTCRARQLVLDARGSFGRRAQGGHLARSPNARPGARRSMPIICGPLCHTSRIRSGRPEPGDDTGICYPPESGRSSYRVRTATR